MTMSRFLQARLTDTATVTAVGTPAYNSRGDPRYSGSSVTYQARFEMEPHMVMGPDGRALQAQGVAYVGPTTAGVAPSFDMRHKMVRNSDGAVLKMLVTLPLKDKDGGTDHIEVHFG